MNGQYNPIGCADCGNDEHSAVWPGQHTCALRARHSYRILQRFYGLSVCYTRWEARSRGGDYEEKKWKSKNKSWYFIRHAVRSYWRIHTRVWCVMHASVLAVQNKINEQIDVFILQYTHFSIGTLKIVLQSVGWIYYSLAWPVGVRWWNTHNIYQIVILIFDTASSIIKYSGSGKTAYCCPIKHLFIVCFINF